MPLPALFAILVAALVGAAVVARTGTRSLPLRASAGALGGGLGALAVSAPIDFCTFSDEYETKDYVFGLVLMAAGAAAGIAAARAAMAPERKPDTNATSHSVWRNWWMPWLLLSPTLAVLVVFLYWPAIETIRYSTKLARLSNPKQVDRCVYNFTELIGPSRPWLALVLAGLGAIGIAAGALLDRQGRRVNRSARTIVSAVSAISLFAALAFIFTDDYRQVYVVTMIISVGTVVGGLAISLGIAFIAYQPIRGASVYRTLLIWPYAISPPIAGLLFFVIFDANTGIIDHWTTTLLDTGLADYRTTPVLAQLVVIMASIWKTLGYNLLFYVAGLQTIPPDQVEAAMIDGASAWQRFRYVVIPALSPITFFLIVTNLTYAFFETYGTIDYLTKGGPAGSTNVAMYEIIQVFNTGGDLGRGSAQSMILFAGVVGLTMWQFRSTGRRVTYG